MRILVLSNLYPPHYLGGYELLCQSLVKALRNRDHVVHVLSSDFGVERRAEGASRDGVVRKLHIHGLYGKPWLGILRLSRLERHNNAVLRETIARVKPELVYVWNFGGLGRSMLFTLQSLGVPTVFAVCDHWIARSARSDVWLRWWNRKDGPLRQRALRKALSWAGLQKQWHRQAPTCDASRLRFRRVYFCSEALRTLTASEGFKVRHGAVIYCPVDTKRFRMIERLPEDGFRRLLYVGRLTADKGVMTALQAMAKIRGRYSGQLSIYGAGDPAYEAALKRYARENDLAVRFAGLCRPEEMAGVYRGHDGLLFTSEWPEPFALTPLEAMSSGMPVIGTLCGGSAELFRHCENAMVYTAGRAEELAQRIIQLNEDPALRMRIAAAGAKEVRCRFSEPLIVDQVEDYLRETVETWPHERSTKARP